MMDFLRLLHCNTLFQTIFLNQSDTPVLYVVFRLHLEVLGSVRTSWWCWLVVQLLQPLPASELSSKRITSAVSHSTETPNITYSLADRRL